MGLVATPFTHNKRLTNAMSTDACWQVFQVCKNRLDMTFLCLHLFIHFFSIFQIMFFFAYRLLYLCQSASFLSDIVDIGYHSERKTTYGYLDACIVDLHKWWYYMHIWKSTQRKLERRRWRWYKLEQLERMRSEIPTATPWLLILVIYIRSKVKTRQSQSYKFKRNVKINILKFGQKLYTRHTCWSCLIGCINMKWIQPEL